MVATAWSGRGRLEQLVAELNRQKTSKLDFVADMRNLTIVNREKGLMLAPADALAEEWLPAAGLPINAAALPQFGGRCTPDVPTRFLRELVEANAPVAATLVNDLLQSDPKRHFIRTLDGRVRAFLSNSYRVLDNYDLAFAALDVARQNGGEVIEASLSDTHMRIKFTTRAIYDMVVEARGGEGRHGFVGRDGEPPLPGGPGTVHPLVTISNSETGHGGVNIACGILRAMCFNGSIIEGVQSHIHLGGKLETGVYTEETIAAESKVVMLKCRDAITAAFQPERFEKLVKKINGVAENRIERPAMALENVVAAGALTDEAHDAILSYFLSDYDRNAYGLAQAVSRYSQDVADPDDAYGLEELAGKVMVGAIALK